MLRKTMIAFAAIASISFLAVTDASARGGFHGRGHTGGFHAGGFHSGSGWRGGSRSYGWRGTGWRGGSWDWRAPAVGLGLAGAYGSWEYPYEDSAGNEFGNGDCYVVRRRVWTDWAGWQARPVQVCN